MTSAVKLNVGSTLTWRDSGGDYAITLNSLAAATGRIGARGDLGAWPRPSLYRWYIETAWAANPAANETLDFYMGFWDSDTPANPWAQVASTDSVLTATQRQNLKYIGAVMAAAANTNTYSSGGVLFIPTRYISPVLYNASAAKALAAAATTPTILRLTPIYPEAQ